ncbi:hypothetical protein [Aurantiacibacter spongiae]|uniref:Uncharacterized protein n=1 Tax=Aurantiacibacter spongiae TaxID=2488860 RepID=A0A3N5CX82_9SPHN|nr:hypothetical protein [Aurantiacibacter spongiae]RPF71259.1 hypothetical protein EG799_06285 [Aurantiacibacter spongiae]
MPKRVKPRQDQKGQNLRPNWKAIFLETLAETSNVTRAAQACNAMPSYAYRHRRQDPVFRRRWSEALLEGYEHLELETLERLRFGTPPGDRKFDIASALRLLAAHREAAAREKARQSKRDRAVVLASLTKKLEMMRERKVAAEEMLRNEGVIRLEDHAAK